MDHQNCRDLLESLSEYIDGSLGKELCDDIERHMADCQNCRVVVDSLKKTIYLYQVNNEPAEIPEDVRKRLFHRLQLDDYLSADC
jgi:anti-sigma factor (TIGR02949 family)